MKTSLTLNKAELSQAVADYVAKALGASTKGDVIFTVSADYDFADRAIGTHTVTATYTYELATSPALEKDTR